MINKVCVCVYKYTRCIIMHLLTSHVQINFIGPILAELPPRYGYWQMVVLKENA